MLGHRGCRLGITFPEITAMQTRAILSAACELKQEGKNPMPEIMVPLIGILYEFHQQKEIIEKVAKQVFAEYGTEVEFEKRNFRWQGYRFYSRLLLSPCSFQ